MKLTPGDVIEDIFHLRVSTLTLIPPNHWTESGPNKY
jgi:hypothetical protein